MARKCCAYRKAAATVLVRDDEFLALLPLCVRCASNPEIVPAGLPLAPVALAS